MTTHPLQGSFGSVFFSRFIWQRSMAPNGGEKETWVPFFSYALLPPILPLLPVLALPRNGAIRCTIQVPSLNLKKYEIHLKHFFKIYNFPYKALLSSKGHMDSNFSTFSCPNFSNSLFFSINFLLIRFQYKLFTAT